jgi:hypothetical protein
MQDLSFSSRRYVESIFWEVSPCSPLRVSQVRFSFMGMHGVIYQKIEVFCNDLDRR